MSSDPSGAGRGQRPRTSGPFQRDHPDPADTNPPSTGDGEAAAADRGAAAPDREAAAPDPEPDVRFTYANERTFLAWNRTALALIATGVAATQLLPKLHISWGRRLLGIPLIGLGAIVAVESFRHWKANDKAMRRGEPLPRSYMPVVLAAGICVVAVIAVVVAALGTK
jgi:putative membrane protein